MSLLAAIVAVLIGFTELRNGLMVETVRYYYRRSIVANSENLERTWLGLALAATGVAALMSVQYFIGSHFLVIVTEVFWWIGRFQTAVFLFLLSGAGICWSKLRLLNIFIERGWRIRLLDRVTWWEDLGALILTILAIMVLIE